MNDRYHIFDHTADTGIEIFGKTINELFINAAAGMYHIVGISATDTGNAVTRMKLIEPTLDDLLVSFLSELNFLITLKGKALCPIKNLTVAKIGENFILTVSAASQKLSKPVLSGLREIKSVTYHQLQIVLEQDRYYARVIFDI